MSIESRNCTTCNKDLSEGFRSDKYINNVVVESLCYKCDKILTFNEYVETRRLSTRFIMDNMMDLYERSKMLWNEYTYFSDLLNTDKYADILYNPIHFNKWLELSTDSIDENLKIKLKAFAATRKVESRIKEFEEKIWFGGLQKQIRASTKKGVSAKVMLGKVEYAVLTYSMCGRTMITFDLPDCSVTAITAEDETERRCMGIQGIDATEERALNLIDTALSLWELGTLVFKDDTKVSLGIPGL